MAGMLVAEADGMYQPIAVVNSTQEAIEMARVYAIHAGPDSGAGLECPPSEFIVWWQGATGAYSRRETITL